MNQQDVGVLARQGLPLSDPSAGNAKQRSVSPLWNRPPSPARQRQPSPQRQRLSQPPAFEMPLSQQCGQARRSYSPTAPARKMAHVSDAARHISSISDGPQVPAALADLAKRLDEVLRLLAADPQTAEFVPELMSRLQDVDSILQAETGGRASLTSAMPIGAANANMSHKSFASENTTVHQSALPAMQQLEENVRGLEALLTQCSSPTRLPTGQNGDRRYVKTIG